jgi:hypothetical protein
LNVFKELLTYRQDGERRMLMKGYLVEYKRKTSLFFQEKPGDNFSKPQKVLLEQEKLIEMLQRPLSYMVISVYLVDVEQYRLNHSEVIFGLI